MKNLPLAEKTNIKNWDFETLVTTTDNGQSFDISKYQNDQNTLVFVDGNLIYEALDANISLEIINYSAEVSMANKLMALINEKKNSKFKITVAKNAHIEVPLFVVNVAKTGSLVHVAEVELLQGASLNYTETYIGEAKANALISTHYVVGENANLTTHIISELHEGTTVYHTKRTDVAASGVIDATNFMINDTNLVFEDLTYLNETAAEAEVKTVSITTGEQKQNLTVRIENVGHRSVGNIINYGITKDNAHLAFNGVGKIIKDAKGCDNQQETRLLNLSKTAQAIANPFLLIDEGDITAGHAASIGQLNEEQIYYLMSRGMSRQEASKMIVSGFLSPFVGAIEDETMRDGLSARIEAKLG